MGATNRWTSNLDQMKVLLMLRKSGEAHHQTCKTLEGLWDIYHINWLAGFVENRQYDAHFSLWWWPWPVKQKGHLNQTPQHTLNIPQTSFIQISHPCWINLTTWYPWFKKNTSYQNPPPTSKSWLRGRLAAMAALSSSSLRISLGINLDASEQGKSPAKSGWRWGSSYLNSTIFKKMPLCGEGCCLKYGCQESVLNGRYDSEVWFVVCFGGVIRGMICLMPENMASKPRYDSWVWFGAWFRIWFEACGHKFCLSWKHSDVYKSTIALIFRSVCRMFTEMNWVQTCSISTTPSVHTIPISTKKQNNVLKRSPGCSNIWSFHELLVGGWTKSIRKNMLHLPQLSGWLPWLFGDAYL